VLATHIMLYLSWLSFCYLDSRVSESRHSLDGHCQVFFT